MCRREMSPTVRFGQELRGGYEVDSWVVVQDYLTGDYKDSPNYEVAYEFTSLELQLYFCAASGIPS